MDAVRAHQRRDGGPRAVGEGEMHARRVLRDPGGPLAEADALGGQRLLQRAQQVGAVQGELRGAVFRLRLAGHGQDRGFRARVPVAADAVRGAGAMLAQGRADAEPVQGAHGVGRQVDVGADAGEPARLLEDQDLAPGAVQRDGGSEAADAAADDADGGTGHVRSCPG